MDCEIIIPCFRESRRLPLFLRSLTDELRVCGFRGAITIVDDASGEGEVRDTLDAIAPLVEAGRELFREPLLLRENLGKGGAVYAGWREAAKNGPEFLAFADADGSTSAAELCRMIRHALAHRGEADAWFGSRIKMLGRTIERHLSRHIIGRCFATLTTLITGLAIYDSQCGAKVLKREAFLGVEPQLRETGFAFDVELAVGLLLAGHRVVEFPVSWCDMPGSKVRLVRDVFRMTASLWRIRRRFGRWES